MVSRNPPSPRPGPATARLRPNPRHRDPKPARSLRTTPKPHIRRGTDPSSPPSPSSTAAPTPPPISAPSPENQPPHPLNNDARSPLADPKTCETSCPLFYVYFGCFPVPNPHPYPSIPPRPTPGPRLSDTPYSATPIDHFRTFVLFLLSSPISPANTVSPFSEAF